MSDQDNLILKIYVLLSSFLILGLALGMVWLTGWMDRHELQRGRSAE